MNPSRRDSYRRKTGDLATPPRDRLVPIRDLASLLACTESDIENLCDKMGITLEPLTWRGVVLASVTFEDMLHLHVALRLRMVEGEPVEGRKQLAAELAAEQDLRRSAEDHIAALELHILRRDKEMAVWEDRLSELEIVVDERRKFEQDVLALRIRLQALQESQGEERGAGEGADGSRA